MVTEKWAARAAGGFKHASRKGLKMDPQLTSEMNELHEFIRKNRADNHIVIGPLDLQRFIMRARRRIVAD